MEQQYPEHLIEERRADAKSLYKIAKKLDIKSKNIEQAFGLNNADIDLYSYDIYQLILDMVGMPPEGDHGEFDPTKEPEGFCRDYFMEVLYERIDETAIDLLYGYYDNSLVDPNITYE